MENTPEIGQTNTTPSAPFIFQAPDVVKYCSTNKCANGHEWPPTVQVAQCPGCKAPLLAIKMEQCPVCNEPPTTLNLRSDHLPKNGAITPICRGSDSLAEVGVVHIEYTHATNEQNRHKVREMPGKV